MTGPEVALTVLMVVCLALGLHRLRLGWPLALALACGAGGLYTLLRLTIMAPPQALSTCIFVLAYALIAGDRLHKTTIALAGAVAMILVGLVGQQEAFHGSDAVAGIDWNTVFLLIGMMIIVNITRHTGVFQWLAVKTAKWGKGDPLAIVILLSLVTAVVSAALDNVTTVLLIAPVAVLLCQTLRISPVPLLICIVLASNIGGTATLIGDPPNIMIASAAHLSFLDFLKIDGPVVLLILAVFLATLWPALGPRMHVSADQRAAVMAIDESGLITNRRLLRRSLVVIGLTLAGFGLHAHFGLEPATIALAGAVLMMLSHHEGVEEALREVEWPTIFFFIGLFIMVSALVKSGVVIMMGQGILTLTQGNPLAMAMLVLWFSALASGIIDNIPFVATMTALVHGVAMTLHPEAATFVAAAHAPDVLPLWWALSLGACLGGNFTIVGASANVVVAGLAARTEHPISFIRFMKYGIPVTLQGLIISSVWLWLRFLR